MGIFSLQHLIPTGNFFLRYPLIPTGNLIGVEWREVENMDRLIIRCALLQIVLLRSYVVRWGQILGWVLLQILIARRQVIR